ncbi:hypothetical protein [Pantoea sp. UBA6567]|uniref:hypothetical protein n=1 Tax=Pantoea sp. UBA6567 TaxID=1947043 RepID=UPI00259A5BC7|nr:hypothetical protein [Pantoea sp. UBA6567]
MKMMAWLSGLLFLVALGFAIYFSERTAVSFAFLFAAFACTELFIDWSGIQDGIPKKVGLTITKAIPVIAAIVLAFDPNL